MASENHHFDLQRLCDLFIDCQDKDGFIQMDHYVDAYEELSKLFKLMGTVFGFVTSDVIEKVGILRDYRKSDGENYGTVQAMIDYEVKNNLTNNKHKPSGSRTLLRLHRALEFVMDFMKAIKDADEHAKMASLASHSYDRSLAKHHPWLVRKGVHLAVYTLPTRQGFIDRLKISSVEKTEELLGRVVDLQNSIYDIVQDLYASNNLLNLP